MSQLDQFRDHCRAMANGAHGPECIAGQARDKSRWAHFRIFGEWLEAWGERPRSPGGPAPCEGDCVQAADRRLFARLADEVEEYQHRDLDLFGDLTIEPAPEDAL